MKRRKIERGIPVNTTEKTLSDLCDLAFLKLWSFPNPYKEPGKELCDVLVVFDNNIIIFSVKNIKYNENKGLAGWQRWKRKAIDESITQINGAEKWIKNHPDQIYLNKNCNTIIPINSKKKFKIYRIVVAHGISDSIANIPGNTSGSLGIKYSDNNDFEDVQYFVELPKSPIYHILDSANLEILLKELDTITDFINYLKEKEKAIKLSKIVTYTGEEDVMGQYLRTIEPETGKHYILKDKNKDLIVDFENIIWKNFSNSYEYKEKKILDKSSYLWDKYLQQLCEYALNGELTGNIDIFQESSPIKEMAKESRFYRRILSGGIIQSVNYFPEIADDYTRQVRLIMSEDNKSAYVFLQIKYNEQDDYETVVRPKRRQMLNIACGTLKNKHSFLQKIVGIAINSPKHHIYADQDYILLDCKKWTRKDRSHYYNLNKDYNFWKQKNELKVVNSYEYPSANSVI